MAIDSKAKRISCIGIGLPVPSLLPVANSSISAEDRMHLSWLYAYNFTVSYILSAIVKIRITATGDVEL